MRQGWPITSKNFDTSLSLEDPKMRNKKHQVAKNKGQDHQKELTQQSVLASETCVLDGRAILAANNKSTATPSPSHPPLGALEGPLDLIGWHHSHNRNQQLQESCHGRTGAWLFRLFRSRVGTTRSAHEPMECVVRLPIVLYP